jgi:hypothetical protein
MAHRKREDDVRLVIDTIVLLLIVALVVVGLPVLG